MPEEPQNHFDYDEIDLVELFRILMKSWKLIVTVFIITVLVVGSVTYFWIPKKYLSYTSFFLRSEGEYVAIFSKVNMAKEVILSNHFLRGILEKSGIDTTQAMIEQLQKAINISGTGSGSIRLELIWDDPQRAFDLLSLIYDGYKDEVGKKIGIYATQQLEMAEEQLARSKEMVNQANAELVAFQRKNGIIFLPGLLMASDRYYQELKESLASSVDNLLEFENLVIYHAAAREVYIEACKNYEIARQLVEKERKYEFITIEPPVYPEQEHSPSLVMNMTMAGIFALFIGVMLAYFREYIHNYKKCECVNLRTGI